MNHVHFDDTKENNQVTEAADEILNTIEIIRNKKKQRPDIDAIHDNIIKTEASNADKTLIENL